MLPWCTAGVAKVFGSLYWNTVLVTCNQQNNVCKKKKKKDMLWSNVRTPVSQLGLELRPSLHTDVHSCWHPAWSSPGRERCLGRRNHCGWQTQHWTLCHRICRSIVDTQKKYYIHTTSFHAQWLLMSIKQFQKDCWPLIQDFFKLNWWRYVKHSF